MVQERSEYKPWLASRLLNQAHERYRKRPKNKEITLFITTDSWEIVESGLIDLANLSVIKIRDIGRPVGSTKSNKYIHIKNGILEMNKICVKYCQRRKKSIKNNR